MHSRSAHRLLDSGRSVNPRGTPRLSRGPVVVAVAVFVHIAEVRAVPGIGGAQPPVVARYRAKPVTASRQAFA